MFIQWLIKKDQAHGNSTSISSIAELISYFILSFMLYVRFKSNSFNHSFNHSFLQVYPFEKLCITWYNLWGFTHFFIDYLSKVDSRLVLENSSLLFNCFIIHHLIFHKLIIFHTTKTLLTPTLYFSKLFLIFLYNNYLPDNQNQRYSKAAS